MLTIETNGPWRQMGAQIGETFRDETHRCLDRFLKWARNNPARAAETATIVKSEVKRHAPSLAEETIGFAEGADMDETTAWQYRFMNDVRLRVRQDPEECCVIRIEDDEKGPLLGRNCDLEPERKYLENAYARYGRIVHQLDGASPPRSVGSLRTLLTDVAQPGLCNTGRDGESLTAYSFILELDNGIVHYVPGHPGENDWKTVTPSLKNNGRS